MTIKPQARALLATTALALAGLAATAGGAQAALPALHGSRIALGPTSSLFGNAFTEAPNGVVFFSRGSVVYVVEGNHAPEVALHAGGPVLALGATDSVLFAETGLRFTEYCRADGRPVAHWTLTSPVARVTTAGLYVVGDTVWAWTDWAADGSGFEYAQVDRIHTASSAVHVVDRSAFPGDMSADGHAFPCSSATVGKLNTATGGTSAALPTPGAYQLLNGPAVIEASDAHGTHADLFLVRISS